MRVGIYFPDFDPLSGGGHTFEREVLQALLEIAEESHHELIVYFRTDPKAKPFPTPPNTKNLYLKWLPQRLPVPKVSVGARLVRILKKLTRTYKPAVSKSHLQSAIEEDNIHLIWFATVTYAPVEIPYIATVWDVQHRIQPWFPEVSQNGQWDVRESYFRSLVQRATYILVPNQAGLNELSFCYQVPKERFRCLTHPVPYIEYRPLEDEINLVKDKYGLSKRYVFYPAQFWSHKNHVNLIKAIKILRETYQVDLELVCAGSDQGNLDYVRSVAADLHLDNVVHFLGFVPREDLIALYKGAFALTYVTYFGPENLPPLEAFACGCPVIVSNVDGSQEQFGDAVLRVDPSKPDQIALAIKKLEDDPALRATLVARGDMRSKEYTGTDYVRDVFRILDEFESIRANWPPA